MLQPQFWALTGHVHAGNHTQHDERVSTLMPQACKTTFSSLFFSHPRPGECELAKLTTSAQVERAQWSCDASGHSIEMDVPPVRMARVRLESQNCEAFFL